jgi:hypothetical protein
MSVIGIYRQVSKVGSVNQSISRKRKAALDGRLGCLDLANLGVKVSQ